MKPLAPQVPPPLPPSSIPLFNPQDVLLRKKDALQAKERDGTHAQGGNPYRKSVNGMV